MKKTLMTTAAALSVLAFAAVASAETTSNSPLAPATMSPAASGMQEVKPAPAPEMEKAAPMKHAKKHMVKKHVKKHAPKAAPAAPGAKKE